MSKDRILSKPYRARPSRPWMTIRSTPQWPQYQPWSSTSNKHKILSFLTTVCTLLGATWKEGWGRWCEWGCNHTITHYLRKPEAPHLFTLPSNQFCWRCSVDHETVRHLELLRSLRVDIVNITGGGNSKTSIQERHRDADNVFDSINFTNTPLGTRLLRSQLVAPPIDIDTINMRQDCVVELLSSETMFLQTSMALTKLLDLDVLIGQVSFLCCSWSTPQSGAWLSSWFASNGIASIQCRLLTSLKLLRLGRPEYCSKRLWD